MDNSNSDKPALREQTSVNTQCDAFDFYEKSRSNVSSLLKGVCDYYVKTKGIGHTRALFTGVGYPVGVSTEAPRPTVVASTKLHAKILNSEKYLALTDFKQMEDRREILIWDNSAIHQLAHLALCRINELEDQVAELKRLAADPDAPRKLTESIIPITLECTDSRLVDDNEDR